MIDHRDRDDELWMINDVTVGGIPYFDMYKSCLQHKARVEPITEHLSKCSKTESRGGSGRISWKTVYQKMKLKKPNLSAR